jgi:hypothetical protein
MTDPTTLKLVDNIGAARGTDYLCLSEIKLAHTDDEVRQEMA